jgi:hypothetical protein
MRKRGRYRRPDLLFVRRGGAEGSCSYGSGAVRRAIHRATVRGGTDEAVVSQSQERARTVAELALIDVWTCVWA